MSSPALNTGEALRTAPILPAQIEGRFLVGALFEFIHDPLHFLERAAREHGDAVRIRLAHTHVYTFNHPELIEEVLVSKSANFVKSLDLRETKHALGEGLLTSEGDHWRRERKLAQPAFHHDRIAGYGRLMTEFAESRLATWREGEAFDVHHEMMQLTLDIIAKALFDEDVRERAATVGRAVETVLEQFHTRSNTAFLLPTSLPTPGNLRARKGIQKLDEMIYGMIEERRKRPRKSRDLLSVFLEARYEDGSAMPEKQIRDELVTLLSAGHETTAIALSWTWLLLAQNPEAERKLAAELKAVLGGSTPTVGDLSRLIFTQSVVRESMRLYPPAWMIGRESVRDCEIGGCRVPGRTTVYISPWVMHRDPRFFDEPERFSPERWTDEYMKRLPKFAYLPFGGGPRVCIGAGFAMMEAALLLATIAQRVQLSLAPGQRITPWPTITLRPRPGIFVIARKR